MAQAQARDGAPGAVPTGDMPAAHAPVPVEASASAVPLASFDLTMATPGARAASSSRVPLPPTTPEQYHQLTQTFHLFFCWCWRQPTDSQKAADAVRAKPGRDAKDADRAKEKPCSSRLTSRPREELHKARAEKAGGSAEPQVNLPEEAVVAGRPRLSYNHHRR